MKPIPLNPDTEKVARRIIWFEPPVEALADPVRFMAHAMSHATPEDMKVIRRYVSDDDFREALDRAPPGIIDPAHGRIGIRSLAVSRRRRCQSANSVRADFDQLESRVGWAKRSVPTNTAAAWARRKERAFAHNVNQATISRLTS